MHGPRLRVATMQPIAAAQPPPCIPRVASTAANQLRIVTSTLMCGTDTARVQPVAPHAAAAPPHHVGSLVGGGGGRQPGGLHGRQATIHGQRVAGRKGGLGVAEPARGPGDVLWRGQAPQRVQLVRLRAGRAGRRACMCTCAPEATATPGSSKAACRDACAHCTDAQHAPSQTAWRAGCPATRRRSRRTTPPARAPGSSACGGSSEKAVVVAAECQMQRSRMPASVWQCFSYHAVDAHVAASPGGSCAAVHGCARAGGRRQTAGRRRASRSGAHRKPAAAAVAAPAFRPHARSLSHPPLRPWRRPMPRGPSCRNPAAGQQAVVRCERQGGSLR